MLKIRNKMHRTVVFFSNDSKLRQTAITFFLHCKTCNRYTLMFEVLDGEKGKRISESQQQNYYIITI